ncbi:MAG TPA: right-handed parallel beta-helix repeat-containing protein, partial [Candidatus Angelobacter sp.]
MFAAGPAAAQNVAGPTTGPRIWLQENQPLPVQHVAVTLSAGQGMQPADSSALAGLGQGQPVSLASGDLDADGFDDLVVGYRTPTGGVISIHRGNMDAFAPQSDASFQAIGQGKFPSPFLLEAKTFQVPVSPDFLALGNFSGSGNKDLVVASKGGNTLYIFPADGKGNFASPEAVSLPGGVNSLASGELGSSHTPALIVGMSGAGRSYSLAVYVWIGQGLAALAQYPLTAPASNIVFGDFNDPSMDVAFLTGGQIQILRSSTMQLSAVSLPVTVRAFDLGSFIYDRTGSLQIALVAPDGSVQIAVRNEFDPRVYTASEFQAIRKAKINHQPAPAFVPVKSFPANGWRVAESFPGAASVGAGQAPLLFRTRVASNGADDVMVLNAFSGQLTLISHPDLPAGAQTFLPGQISLRPYSGSPVAALPMRINVDGRPGVIALHQGEIAPSLVMPIPDPTFTVNTTNDTLNAGACAAATPNECSLREAVVEANAAAGTDTIMVPAGTYALTLGRTVAEPGIPAEDARTGTLNVNDSVNIVGANQSTTIITWGTPTPAGSTVDMVMSVNEDIQQITAATASISNLTIQNGVNNGSNSEDGDGGCMEFDTGTNGTATLTLTNVTLKNCSTTQGGGGGLVIFNFVTPAGGGGATISNSIIQGNSVVDVGQAGNGGGIAIAQDAHMTMTASQVLNNN